MWAQLNVLHTGWAGAMRRRWLAPGNLPRLLGRVSEACQTHAGITEGTLHRDQGSSFYRMGRCIERADQTTRLIDIKYHALLPKPDAVGSPVDIGQWNVVLLSAAAHTPICASSPGGVTPGGGGRIPAVPPALSALGRVLRGRGVPALGLLGSATNCPARKRCAPNWPR